LNYVEATSRAVIDISEVRRVFVATIVMELQYRASGPLRSICDRWSGLLVVIHPFREAEPWVHRLLPDRVAGRRKGRRVERTYCNPADRWVAVSFPIKRGAAIRAAPDLWDNSHRNGKRCQSDAGTLCSGTDKPDRVHLWQLLEASRSGIARPVPPAFPPRLVCPHFG